MQNPKITAVNHFIKQDCNAIESSHSEMLVRSCMILYYGNDVTYNRRSMLPLPKSPDPSLQEGLLCIHCMIVMM